jgi:hypothetical protein
MVAIPHRSQLINREAIIAGAIADRYANSGRIFLTTITVARNNKTKKKMFTLKYEAGDFAAKLVAYITIAVMTGYSTLLSSLANGQVFVSKPRLTYRADKSL